MAEAASVQPISSEVLDGGSNLLLEMNRRLDLEVKERLGETIAAISAEHLPSPGDYLAVRLDGEIRQAVEGGDELTRDAESLPITPPTKKNELTQGVDLAFNVAGVARERGVGPVNLADETAKRVLSIDAVKESTNIGPFVNIELDYDIVAPRVLSEVAAFGKTYGMSRDGEPELVLVDYSSPNVAKNMTVAHLRSTIIGHALIKLQHAAGNIPFGINHIGDWGTQFGNIIYQYRKEVAERGDEFLAELDANPTATLMKIYRQFNEDTKDDKNPDAIAEAREIFLQLEQGDPELVELWSKFREWSLVDFGPSYARLGINFDAIQGESFYEDRMPSTVSEALEAGVLRLNEEGAVVFPSQPLADPRTGAINDKLMLSQEGEPRDEIIVKPSGGTVYLTRDLAAARYRSQELGADKVLYVIGKEQRVHCLELFAMAEQLGYFALGDAVHISFGHLNMDGRKMKSREGKVVLLNDILDEMTEAADDLLTSRYGGDEAAAELLEDQDIARQIGTSALVFNDLRQDRENDIEFNPEAAKTLEVGGSVYVQYTNARLRRLLEKAGPLEPMQEVPELLTDGERLLVSEMARFPLVIADAARTNNPHKVANFLSQFCRTASSFYHDTPIIKAESHAERVFRLHVVAAATQVIENAADILHIELPEKM